MQIRRVEWIETAGELGAQLVEARLIKERQPLHNRAPNRNDEVTGLRLLANRRKPPIFERVRLSGRDPLDWGENLYGTFRNKREIDKHAARVRPSVSAVPAPPRHRIGQGRGMLGLPDETLRWRLCRARERCRARCTPGRRTRRAAPETLVVARADRDSRVEAGRQPHRDPGRRSLVPSRFGRERNAAGGALLGAPPRQFDVDAHRILSRWLAVEGTASRSSRARPRLSPAHSPRYSSRARLTLHSNS